VRDELTARRAEADRLMAFQAPLLAEAIAFANIAPLEAQGEAACTYEEAANIVLAQLQRTGAVDRMAQSRANTMSLQSLRTLNATLGTPTGDATDKYAHALVEAAVTADLKRMHAEGLIDGELADLEPPKEVSASKINKVQGLRELLWTGVETKPEDEEAILKHVANLMHGHELDTLLGFYGTEQGKRIAGELEEAEQTDYLVLQDRIVQGAIADALATGGWQVQDRASSHGFNALDIVGVGHNDGRTGVISVGPSGDGVQVIEEIGQDRIATPSASATGTPR